MLDEEQAALLRRCVVAAAPKKLSDDQIRGLQLVCSGRDGLVLLRTGGGKTLLWQLPASLDGGLTIVVVPSVALALDLKESTDKFFAGKSLFCCHDLRSEGERGEAVESTTVPSAAAAPSAPQAADRIGMAWAAHARPWQCGECAGCTSKRFRCTFKCGTCSNCTKKKGCLERREREDAWATAEATRAAAAAAATDVTDVTDATVAAAGTPTPATGGNAGGRTRSRIAGLDEAATEPDERPVTEAEVRDARRVGTASHAALCDASVAVIITTPEGVADEYRESQRLRLALERCGRLRRVVIDEAHCRLLSSHGSFRPAYAALGGFLGYLSDAYRIQVLGFSATVPPPLRPTLADDLGMRCPVDPIVGELDRPEISFATFPLPVRPRQSFASLVEEAWRVAESSAPEWAWAGRVLIYTTTTVQAKVTASVIEDVFRVACRVYCSRGMTASERARSLAEYDSGDVRILVGTKALAQGLDRPDISLVIHLGLPQDLDEWCQENGRAARVAGWRGLALTFLHPRFVNDRLRLAMADGGDGGGAMCGVARLLRLLTEERCLREAALEYLGGWRSERCPPIECCCRCQRRLNGDMFDQPIIGMTARESHRAAGALLRETRTRIAKAPYGLLTLPRLMNEPGTAASATEHALLAMALVGQGSLALRQVVTDSGWSSAAAAVSVNELEADRYEAGSSRLLLAMPYRPPDPPPPPSAQHRAEALQALLAQHTANEAGIARLPNLFDNYFDAGGDVEALPHDLQARLREATAQWLLPEAQVSEAQVSEAARAPLVEEAVGEAIRAMDLDGAVLPSSKKRERAQAIPSPSVARVLRRVRDAMLGSPSRSQASAPPSLPPSGGRTGKSPPKALFR